MVTAQVRLPTSTVAITLRRDQRSLMCNHLRSMKHGVNCSVFRGRISSAFTVTRHGWVVTYRLLSFKRVVDRALDSSPCYYSTRNLITEENDMENSANPNPAGWIICDLDGCPVAAGRTGQDAVATKLSATGRDDCRARYTRPAAIGTRHPRRARGPARSRLARRASPGGLSARSPDRRQVAGTESIFWNAHSCRGPLRTS